MIDYNQLSVGLSNQADDWTIKLMIDYRIKLTINWKSNKSNKIMYYVHLWLSFFMINIQVNFTNDILPYFIVIHLKLYVSCKRIKIRYNWSSVGLVNQSLMMSSKSTPITTSNWVPEIPVTLYQFLFSLEICNTWHIFGRYVESEPVNWKDIEAGGSAMITCAASKQGYQPLHFNVTSSFCFKKCLKYMILSTVKFTSMTSWIIYKRDIKSKCFV